MPRNSTTISAAPPVTADTGTEPETAPTDTGTPQGGLISPLLSNLTLDGMEQAVKAVARPGDKVHFVRYADDCAPRAKHEPMSWCSA